MPGWTASLDRDKAAGTVSSVTWTANPQVGISSDQFALFRVSVKLPEGDSVTFPRRRPIPTARWCAGIRRHCPAAANPNTPRRTRADRYPSEGHDHEMTAQAAPAATADNTARWLAGGAIILAAVGLALR